MKFVLLAICIVAIPCTRSGFAQLAGTAGLVRDKSAEELLTEAQQALLQRRYRDAADLATKAIDQKSDFSEAYILRGRARQRLGQLQEAVADLGQAIQRKPAAESHMIRGECYSELDRHADAIKDFDRTLELDPKLIAAHHVRGRELFKAGEIAKSIVDFDQFIKLEPSYKNRSWERGLSRYYVGEFAAAQNSFEDFHKVGPEDIENGLWRLLSQAEVEGLPAAQQDLLKYEPKRRPPFPLLYALYAGQAKPEEVLAHASDGATDDADRKTRNFYAQLYLGMWFVVNRDRSAAISHLEKAVALRSSDYMWYVGRLQLERLKTDAKAAE